MSKIDDLIKQYCPNGVKSEELRAVCKFQNGYAFKSSLFKTDGLPILRITNIQNKGIDVSNLVYFNIEDYDTDLEQFKVVENDILIAMSGATTGKIGISKSKEIFYLNQRVGKFIPNKKVLLNGFLYHFIQTKSQEILAISKGNGAQPNLSSEKLKKIKIPVPPLPVQEEIVKVLDAFTALEAELEAELEARKRQYEYYRNKLLTFDENTTGGGIDWKILSEVFDIKNGYTPSKANKEFWKNGTIPWFRMEDIRENGRILNDSIQHITPQAVKGGKLFPANSIIVATTATIGEHALITVDSLANQQFTCLSKKVNRYNELDMKFFYYYMFVIDEWCKNNTNVSGFASVDMNKFKKLMIPIPPIEEQERIVAILDKFDSLVNDISEGLPAELTARRQQYEYYRNKLLTFEEAA